MVRTLDHDTSNSLNTCFDTQNTLKKFNTHNGPTDIETMTNILQLRFQRDADLGGNLDNLHSQTSYLGYLAGSLFCWCSTDQGSVSTSTAESEIKAVNHTLKCEVIANRGMLTISFINFSFFSFVFHFFSVSISFLKNLIYRDSNK